VSFIRRLVPAVDIFEYQVVRQWFDQKVCNGREDSVGSSETDAEAEVALYWVAGVVVGEVGGGEEDAGEECKDTKVI